MAPRLAFTASLAAFITGTALAADTFRLAAYNVENYLDQPTESRKHAKSEEAKAKVREIILEMRPDVLALEEVGSQSALFELRDNLKTGGLDFEYWEMVSGWDTNIHVAVLSKFPIVAQRSHTNDSYLLDGKRFEVSRGFSEVDIQVKSNYTFTLIGAHLKSQRPVPEADEAQMRLEEARILRRHIDDLLQGSPNLNLVVLGDLNDNPNAPPIRTVIGRGRVKLTDTRPGEREGSSRREASSATGSKRTGTASQERPVGWTHYYSVEDIYSRLDYILISPGMAKEWLEDETYIPSIPGWAVASDHRPVLATFLTTDK